MAYKKQLRDKDGNVVYPDVGLNLDDVVYSDDPTEVVEDIIDPSSYSLDEKWTGGYWVDGQKIYKKTIAINSLPNSGGAVTVPLSGVGRIINFEAVMVQGGNSWIIPYKYLDIVSFENRELKVQATTIDLRNYAAIITIYYIKVVPS